MYYACNYYVFVGDGVYGFYDDFILFGRAFF